jgi:hypothetical protein
VCNGLPDEDAILHWNGKHLERIKAKFPGVTNNLYSVAATAPDNAWAVGTWCATHSCRTVRTQLLHWNGRTWSESPRPGGGLSGWLYSVAADSGRDAWASGSRCSGSYGSDCVPLLLHWNGRSWRTVRV